jgi:hypothetical protein
MSVPRGRTVGVEEDRVWPGVVAETKESDRCGRVTVEADGQSSRSPAARLEECARVGVDEPDARRRGDRHSRPVGKTDCAGDGPGGGDRVWGDDTVRASGGVMRAAVAFSGRWRQVGGCGGWAVNGSDERGSVVAMAEMCE